MRGGKRRPNRPFGGRPSGSGEIHTRRKTDSRVADMRANANANANASGDSGDFGRPIQLATSDVVAFVDPNPSYDHLTLVPIYDYDHDVTGGLGLGFQNEDGELKDGEEEHKMDEQEEEQFQSERTFISIGGAKIYTEDCSSPDDNDGCSESGDSTGSEAEEEQESSDESDSSDYDDDSEIDDEMVEDYIEGIGGSSELLSGGRLARKNIEGAFFEFESSSDGEEHGMMMKKKVSKPRKGKGGMSSPVVDTGLSAAMDDLMSVKEPWTASGRRKKKKPPSQLSRSWPRDGQRSRECYGFSGKYQIFTYASFVCKES